MNPNAISFSRHKHITLLFLKHASLRTCPPDEASARVLAKDMENLGAPFVKAARLLSVRGDLLPPSIMQAFAALDDARFRNENPVPESMETVDQVLEDEIGKKALRAFATFHPEPYRYSGAGQVHRATLHDGREVSVRIQRPSARQRIVKDLDTLAEISAFIDHPSGRGSLHRFSRFADRLRVSILRELDYRREEAALIELREKLSGYSRMRVPHPVSGFCSSRVLTTEFIDGSEIWEIPSRVLEDPRELAAQLTGAYLDQIFTHGLIHPQPHLENLLVTPDGDLVITEACGTFRLSSNTRSIFSFLLHAICQADAKAATQAALRLGHASGEAGNCDATALLPQIREALQTGELSTRLRHTARAAASGGAPFPADISMIADLLDHLAAVTEAIAPSFNTQRFVSRYLAEQMNVVRENTILFPAAISA